MDACTRQPLQSKNNPESPMKTLKTVTMFAILLCGVASAYASTRPDAHHGAVADTPAPQRCAIGHEAPHALTTPPSAARKYRMKAEAKSGRQSCLLFRKLLPGEDLKSEDTVADVSGQGRGNSL